MEKDKILIQAHRGASKRAAQNTVPAFEKAILMGADGIETDVHLTKDGIPVICHNYDIDSTSNATGFIADKTFDELRQYDFGSYFSSVYENTKIPALEELFALCAPSGLKIINVEIKNNIFFMTW